MRQELLYQTHITLWDYNINQKKWQHFVEEPKKSTPEFGVADGAGNVVSNMAGKDYRKKNFLVNFERSVVIRCRRNTVSGSLNAPRASLSNTHNVMGVQHQVKEMATLF